MATSTTRRTVRPPASATRYTGPYADVVNAAARANRLDPWWLAAVLYVENRFRATGRSPAGAEGIAQIELSAHPDVSRAQADNPRFAIPWAAKLLAGYRQRAGGSLTRGTIFYNTGPNASQATIDSAGVAYLDQVRAAYRDLRRKYAGAGDAQGALDTVGHAAGAALAYPLGVLGKIIGKPYEGSHRNFGNWESDNAVDIAVPYGTPVYAVGAGTIGAQLGPIDSGNPALAGDRVHLVTGADEFYYAHLSRLAVRAGQKVSKGQLLGYSGRANGVDHLHIAERNTYDPNFQRDPNAQLASFWGDAGKIAKGILAPETLLPSIPGLPHIPGGAIIPNPLDPLKQLWAVGETFKRFLDDPAYPFLWLAFMLVGFALLYVGVTRLFGVRPVREVVVPVAAGAAKAGAMA